MSRLRVRRGRGWGGQRRRQQQLTAKGAFVMLACVCCVPMLLLFFCAPPVPVALAASPSTALGSALPQPVLGVDVGNSGVRGAVLRSDRNIEMVPREGSIPAFVGWDDAGNLLVGKAAKKQATARPELTVFGLQRLLGRKYTDDWTLKQDTEHAKGHGKYPFKLVDHGGQQLVQVSGFGGKPTPTVNFTPEALAAVLLKELKRTAEAQLGGVSVTKAVLTVPASFGRAQREAMKVAATLAGLEVVGMISSPEAAVKAQALDLNRDELAVLVFHVGGDTMEATVVSVDEGVIETLATSGQVKVGGNDLQSNMVEHFLLLLDLDGIPMTRAELQANVAKATHRLSKHQSAPMVKPIADIIPRLTREKFIKLNKPLLDRMERVVQSVLREAGLSGSGVDHVVFSGGSTKLPMVRDVLKTMVPTDARQAVSPTRAVAYGAAMHWSALTAALFSLAASEPVPPVADLFDLDHEAIAAAAATTAAASRLAKEREVNAMIAPSRASQFPGVHAVAGNLVPLTVSVAAPNQHNVTPVFRAPTFVPTTHTFWMDGVEEPDGMYSLKLGLYRGEHSLAKHNERLGELSLSGMPSAHTSVTVEVTAEGGLVTTARHVSGEQESTLTRSPASLLLSDEELVYRRTIANALLGKLAMDVDVLRTHLFAKLERAIRRLDGWVAKQKHKLCPWNCDLALNEFHQIQAWLVKHSGATLQELQEITRYTHTVEIMGPVIPQPECMEDPSRKPATVAGHGGSPGSIVGHGSATCDCTGSTTSGACTCSTGTNAASDESQSAIHASTTDFSAATVTGFWAAFLPLSVACFGAIGLGGFISWRAPLRCRDKQPKHRVGTVPRLLCLEDAKVVPKESADAAEDVVLVNASALEDCSESVDGFEMIGVDDVTAVTVVDK